MAGRLDGGFRLTILCGAATAAAAGLARRFFATLIAVIGLLTRLSKGRLGCLSTGHRIGWRLSLYNGCTRPRLRLPVAAGFFLLIPLVLVVCLLALRPELLLGVKRAVQTIIVLGMLVEVLR